MLVVVVSQTPLPWVMLSFDDDDDDDDDDVRLRQTCRTDRPHELSERKDCRVL